MTLKARVTITIKNDILDPAGEAVKKSLIHQSMLEPKDVRIGKIVDITLDNNEEITTQLARVETAAKKLLSNPIMEDIAIELLDENNS